MKACAQRSVDPSPISALVQPAKLYIQYGHYELLESPLSQLLHKDFEANAERDSCQTASNFVPRISRIRSQDDRPFDPSPYNQGNNPVYGWKDCT